MLLIAILGKILTEVLVAINLGRTAGFLLKNTGKVALRRKTQVVGNLFVGVFRDF